MSGLASAEQLTVVFTDVEQSSAHWERLRDGFKSVLEQHDAIIRECLGRMGGAEVKALGDGFMIVFEQPAAAVAFAKETQQALRAASWPPAMRPLRVRIGMHTGQPLVVRGSDGRPDYYGPVVNRAARVADAGHGGQVLLSSTTAAAVAAALPEGAALLSLGRHRLRGLDEPEEILQLAYAGAPEDQFPPLRTLDAHTHNLPVQLTSFVGREAELRQLAELLRQDRPRLITVLGPGGVGKTRLALQAAADSVGAFADGVWFVDLSETRTSERVPPAIAAVVGLHSDDALAEVKRYLERRQVLLVLDNAEQVVGLASLLASLLRAAPSVQCLVTSRTILHAPGERVFEVDALPLPEVDTPPEALAGYDSVALLMERAGAAGASLELNAQTAGPLARLCRGLDGIPLALELAASRLRHFSPVDLVRRLDQRFELLVSRHPDLPERQRTLRGVLEWSYDLLPPELQSLLAQLSVFHGALAPDAVAEVCAVEDPWAALADLADQSLLRRQEAAGEMRYVMLENVREFAAGQLSPQSRAELQLRHAAVFLRRATVLNREAAGAGEAAALDQLEADLENIRAGMAYSCAGDAWLEVAGYAAATANFLWRRGHWQELADWFASGREALAMLRKPPPDLAAQLLYAATAVALDRGELGLAEQVCEEGLAAARNASDPAREAMFLNLVGILQRRRGDRRAATESCEQALALAQTAGDRRAEGMAWHNLGLLCQDDGEVQQAQEMYERALQVRQEANDTRGAAETLNNLATIAELGEQVQQAAEYFRQAVAAYLQLQDIQGIAISLCNLGEVLGMQGQASAAAELLQPAAQALNELGSVHAEAAQQMFETARAAGGPVLDLARLPWRRGLLEAARAATLEVPRLRRYSP